MRWDDPNEAAKIVAIPGGIICAVAAIVASHPHSAAEAAVLGGKSAAAGAMASYIICWIVVWAVVKLRYRK